MVRDALRVRHQVRAEARDVADRSVLVMGEAGPEPVIMGAAAVFMKVHRTRPLPVFAPLAQFGYRILVPDTLSENPTIVRELDTLLVQARRRAQVITWHNGADDLHVLLNLRRLEGEPRRPGIEAVAEAWKDRGRRDPSTARCVDTSHDLGSAGLISDTATARGLEPVKSFAGSMQQERAQQACEALAEARTDDYAPDVLACRVLSSAVTTALLGGKHAGRLQWEEPLSVYSVLEQVAWQVAPSLLGGVPHARS